MFNFNNPIKRNTLNSTQFSFQGFSAFLDDDGNGKVRIYRFNQEKQKTIILSDTGTVDYDAGLITVDSFAPTAFTGIEMKVSAEPDRLDVIPVREQILIMNSQDATISLIGEAI